MADTPSADKGGDVPLDGSEDESEEPRFSVAQLISAFNRHQQLSTATADEGGGAGGVGGARKGGTNALRSLILEMGADGAKRGDPSPPTPQANGQEESRLNGAAAPAPASAPAPAPAPTPTSTPAPIQPLCHLPPVTDVDVAVLVAVDGSTPSPSPSPTPSPGTGDGAAPWWPADAAAPRRNVRRKTAAQGGAATRGVSRQPDSSPGATRRPRRP